MDKRYEGMNAWVCRSGHIKYTPKNLLPVVCNICGSQNFSPIEEEEIEARVAHR